VGSAVGGASVGITSVSAVVASTGGDDSSASAQAVIKTTTRAAITINFIFMYKNPLFSNRFSIAPDHRNKQDERANQFISS
jgi:predicted PP-loop superfamily ATPase